MNLVPGALHAGLQSVLDTALDAVVVMDPDGNVRGWNLPAQRIFGWTEKEVLGRRLSDTIIPDRHRDSHETGLRRFHETGEGPVLDRMIEIDGLHRDGHEIPVELSITCIDQFGQTLFVGFLRDISERRAFAERQQRMLRESAHRAKNMLAVVAALAKQTIRNSPDLESFEAAFLSRLNAIALAHNLLSGDGLDHLPLETLAEQVLKADRDQGRAHYSGPPVLLAPRQLLGLSMILNELYTNAVKYGALCTEAGRIDLLWETGDGHVTVHWKEAATVCDSAVPSGGFGRKMMEMSARADLGGSILFELQPSGLSAVLRFPHSDPATEEGQ